MAGYPYVGQVTDPNASKALKAAFDLIVGLRSELDALKASALTNAASIQASEQRIVQVADPQARDDAANAGYVRAYVAAQLESFGRTGAAGVFTTSDPFTVTVQNGQIVSIV